MGVMFIDKDLVLLGDLRVLNLYNDFDWDRVNFPHNGLCGAVFLMMKTVLIAQRYSIAAEQCLEYQVETLLMLSCQ